MKFNGSGPPNAPLGPGPTPGGSIRNTLGSGLKASGVFQKDGRIQNFRGGFIGPKQQPPGPPGINVPTQGPGMPSPGPGSSPSGPYYGQVNNGLPGQGVNQGQADGLGTGQGPGFKQGMRLNQNASYGQGMGYKQGGIGNQGIGYNQGGVGNQGIGHNQGGVGNQGIGYNQGGVGNQGLGYNQGGGFNQGMSYGQSGGFGQGGFQGGLNPNPRQLILQAAQQGIVGNGVATISPDHSFILVANLPPPQSFNNGQNAVYATYLVDKKGTSGFLAGVLRSVGNGIYQAQFRSSVPLTHYDRAIVSVENLQNLAQTPNGLIVLKVKEPMGAASFLNPAKDAGSSIWQKITGLFQKKPKPVQVEESQFSPEFLQGLNQAGVSTPGMTDGTGIPPGLPTGN